MPASHRRIYTVAKLKGLYPAPVYEAHFADGSIVRMSFYQELGKPWAYQSGARTCALASWDNPALAGTGHRRVEWKSADEHAAWLATAAAGIWAPRKPLDWLGM